MPNGLVDSTETHALTRRQLSHVNPRQPAAHPKIVTPSFSRLVSCAVGSDAGILLQHRD